MYKKLSNQEYQIENLFNTNYNSLADIVEPSGETIGIQNLKNDFSNKYLQRKYPLQNILLTKTPSNSSTDNIELSNELSSTSTINSGSNSIKQNLKFQRKNEKIIENLSWNISIIKIELDHLNRIKNECIKTFEQVRPSFFNVLIILIFFIE